MDRARRGAPGVRRDEASVVVAAMTRTKAPFHRGEEALQASIGLRERMGEIGNKLIRDHMPEQHRELFSKLPMVFVGALDAQGQPWATVVHGPPGFVHTPDARTLRVQQPLDDQDPAREGVRDGAAIGVLGIELHTRRRNRVNGLVFDADSDGFALRVDQSFGNCPKYIHARAPVSEVTRVRAPALAEGSALSAAARRIVTASDTMFIASSSAGRLDASALAHEAGAGVDVSHRGGPAGFVALTEGADGDALEIEDYPGNAMFNTLGNLLLFPRAGLLFVDWESGDVLQLAASATIVQRGEDERSLQLRVHGGWLRRGALPFAWSAPEAPPQFRVR